MMIKMLMAVTFLLLTASACTGGTGGSVSGIRQSCQSSAGSITCQGTINRLSGRFSHEVETTFYNQGDSVMVEARFDIESGQMQVSINAPDGSQTTAEALPGTSAILSGLATVTSALDANAIPITMEAIDGNVEGISFNIRIRQP